MKKLTKSQTSTSRKILKYLNLTTFPETRNVIDIKTECRNYWENIPLANKLRTTQNPLFKNGTSLWILNEQNNRSSQNRTHAPNPLIPRHQKAGAPSCDARKLNLSVDHIVTKHAQIITDHGESSPNPSSSNKLFLNEDKYSG